MLNGIAIKCASHHNTCCCALGIHICFWDQYLWERKTALPKFLLLVCDRVDNRIKRWTNSQIALTSKPQQLSKPLLRDKQNIFSFFPTAVVGFLRVKGHLLPSPDPTDPTKTDEIAFNEGSDCICWFYCTYRGNCCQRTLDVTEILSGGKPGSESCWDSSRIFTGGGGL